MKYLGLLGFIAGTICGAFGGYYYGTKRQKKLSEAEIDGVRDAFNKTMDETRQKMLSLMEDKDAVGEHPEKIAPNGDVEDMPIRIIPKEEFGYDGGYNEEDITYFAKDEVFYNRDTEKSYVQTNPKEAFLHPKDLFSHFGVEPGKSKYIYLVNDEEKVYYSLDWDDGSYTCEILGYEAEEG